MSDRTNRAFGSRTALADALAVEQQIRDAMAVRAAADHRAWEQSRQRRFIELVGAAAVVVIGVCVLVGFAWRRAWRRLPSEMRM